MKQINEKKNKFKIPLKDKNQKRLAVYSFRAKRERLDEATKLGINIPDTLREAIDYAISEVSFLNSKPKRPWKNKKAP